MLRNRHAAASVTVESFIEVLEPRKLLTTYTAQPIAEYYSFPDDPPAALVVQGFSRDAAYVYGNNFAASRDFFFPLEVLPGNTLSAISNQGVVAGHTASGLNNETSNPFLLDADAPGQARFLIDIVETTVGPVEDIDDLVVVAFGPTGNALLEGPNGAYILIGSTLTYLWSGQVTDETADGTVIGVDQTGGPNVVTWTITGGPVDVPGLTNAWFFGPDGSILATDTHGDLVLRTGDSTRVVRGANVGLPIGVDSAGRAFQMLVTEAPLEGGGPESKLLTGDVQFMDTNKLPFRLASRVDGPPSDHGLVFTGEVNPPASDPREFRSHLMILPDGRIFTPTDVLTPVEGLIPFLSTGPLGSAPAETAPNVIGVNAEGMPFGMRRNLDTGLWNGVGYPELDGAVVSTFFDSKNNETYVIAFGDIPLPNGDRAAGVIYRQLDDGSLTDAQVILSDGAVAITGQLVLFTSADNRVHAVGVNAAGDVMMFYQTGATIDETTMFEWSYDNITQNHLAPQGVAAPGWVGPLTAYVAPWNGLNVAGLDANGDIKVLWWAPGITLWSADNLSEITGMTPLAGSLTSYVTPWGGLNVAGIDSTGDLQVVWWVPEFGSQWRRDNMTEQFNGLKMRNAAAYVSSWGGLNIAGFSEAGGPSVYWWVPGMTDWISEPIGIAGRMASPDWDFDEPMVAVMRGDEQNLITKEQNGNIIRLYWRPTFGDWSLDRVG